MSNWTPIVAVLQTLPWTILLSQLVWSCIIVSISYVLADKSAADYSTLSSSFWTTRVDVPSSVSSGVGWALFVLLAFFIDEASARYYEGQTTISKAGSHLCQIIRLLRQLYPSGTWHDADLERIAAHCVAIPITVKMAVRGEKDATQLESILHPDDIHDVLNAGGPMHVNCTRVIRAYISAVETDRIFRSPGITSNSCPAGIGVRHLLFDLIDTVESDCNVATRISEFRPSVSYVNHLQIFLYIWMMFLPLTLIKTSGW